MNTDFLLELIGYAGSFLVIVSMLMTSVVRLRIINTIGSAIFCGYALCIQSYPTAAMQVCLIVINLISLYRLNNTKKDYYAVEVTAADGFLKHFLEIHTRDIKKFFPEFTVPTDDNRIVLVVCGQTPAGIFVASAGPESTALEVKIDYTIPAYRDCSAGKFIVSYMKGQGIQELIAKTTVPAHEKYLRKIGFVLSEDEANKFVRRL